MGCIIPRKWAVLQKVQYHWLLETPDFQRPSFDLRRIGANTSQQFRLTCTYHQVERYILFRLAGIILQFLAPLSAALDQSAN